MFSFPELIMCFAKSQSMYKQDADVSKLITPACFQTRGRRMGNSGLKCTQSTIKEGPHGPNVISHRDDEILPPLNGNTITSGMKFCMICTLNRSSACEEKRKGLAAL